MWYLPQYAESKYFIPFWLIRHRGYLIFSVYDRFLSNPMNIKSSIFTSHKCKYHFWCSWVFMSEINIDLTQNCNSRLFHSLFFFSIHIASNVMLSVRWLGMTLVVGNACNWKIAGYFVLINISKKFAKIYLLF